MSNNTKINKVLEILRTNYPDVIFTYEKFKDDTDVEYHIYHNDRELDYSFRFNEVLNEVYEILRNYKWFISYRK